MDTFNRIINRKKTDCYKWDYQRKEEAIPFWIADADYATSPFVIQALRNRIQNGIFGYTACGPSFENAVVSWYQKRYHAAVNPQWVCGGIGVVLGIHIALLSFTKVGAGIIIQPPVYHMFQKVIQDTGRIVIENPLKKTVTGYQMDLLDLEIKFQAGYRTLLLCSPHNPVGRIWSKAELKALAQLVKQYDVLVISDEIHSDLSPSGIVFHSLLECGEILPQLIVCNAPSKAFNLAGLTTSYAIIPNDQMRLIYQKTYDKSSLPDPNLLGMSAMIAAYQSGEPWIREQNAHLRTNELYVRQQLEQFLPQIDIAPLEGSYLLWLDLTYLHQTSTHIIQLLDTSGITLSSGTDFGNTYDGFLRMNIACPFLQLQRGLAILIKALQGLTV